MRLFWVFLVAGCYSPQYAPGGKCTTTCPGDLECVQGTCVVPGTVPGGGDDDAGVDAETQNLVDARLIDAKPPIDAPPPDPTLIAHWKFDDDPSDGSILDSTGNGHNGTCSGTECPTLITTAIKGGGYRFDPDLDQHIIVPNSTAFRGSSGTGHFTVAGWMYTDNTTKAISVMAKPVGSNTGNSWQLENLDDDKVSFSGGSVHSLESPNAVPIMTWTHVAGTYDGTTKRLYINGNLVASTSSTISYDSHDVYLGADENNGGLALPFDGQLDDLRYYNRVLPASELQMLAQP